MNSEYGSFWLVRVCLVWLRWQKDLALASWPVDVDALRKEESRIWE